MAQCKSCGAEIVWIKTTNSSMPCDPQRHYYRPDKKGDTVIVTLYGAVIRARLVESEKMIGVGYISHFSTCPNAARHRNKAVPAGEQIQMEV